MYPEQCFEVIKVYFVAKTGKPNINDLKSCASINLGHIHIRFNNNY